jgi:hypothetical protein
MNLASQGGLVGQFLVDHHVWYLLRLILAPGGGHGARLAAIVESCGKVLLEYRAAMLHSECFINRLPVAFKVSFN